MSYLLYFSISSTRFMDQNRQPSTAQAVRPFDDASCFSGRSFILCNGCDIFLSSLLAPSRPSFAKIQLVSYLLFHQMNRVLMVHETILWKFPKRTDLFRDFILICYRWHRNSNQWVWNASTLLQSGGIYFFSSSFGSDEDEEESPPDCP